MDVQTPGDAIAVEFEPGTHILEAPQEQRFAPGNTSRPVKKGRAPSKVRTCSSPLTGCHTASSHRFSIRAAPSGARSSACVGDGIKIIPVNKAVNSCCFISSIWAPLCCFVFIADLYWRA